MKALVLIASLAGLTTGVARAADVPLCQRTPAVTQFIVNQINETQGAHKACADITADDLASLTRVDVENQNLTELKVGDFDGLPNLEILNIRSNPYTTLPEGLFKGLTKLKTLVIIGTKLRYLPDDFLADTPNLEECYCFRNQVRSISESVFQRIEANTTFTALELDSKLQPAETARLQKIAAARPGIGLLLH